MNETDEIRNQNCHPISSFPGMTEHKCVCIGSSGVYHLAYSDWRGEGDGRPIVCVHGLTRNGRDFDYLANSLSSHRRVICPDMPGRGRSDWLPDSKDYALPTYLAAIDTLLAQIDVEEIDWIGTSMGGIIGMILAAMPHTPIRRLVLNDIGPLICANGLKRLSQFVGLDPSFANLDALEADLGRNAAPFGPLTDSQWRHLAHHSARYRPDGTLGYAYDPRIAEPFRQRNWEAIPLWDQWDAIKVPTLVLRGAESDVLEPGTALEMSRRGPHAKVVELAGIGHAPALMADDQIAIVRDFLLVD
jgi:pimeloyl-ACP methyl ester carboxylesterase